MQGAVPKFIKKLTFHNFFKDKVKFNIKRGQDSNVAGKLLLVEFRGKFVDTKRVQLDKLVEEAVISAETTNIESSYNAVTKNLDYMNESFIDRDPLLSASGIIVVYYWLFREDAGKHKDILRNFLVEFDSKRKATRTKKENDLSKEELNYVLFDRLSKSLNDRASLSGCYTILLSEWIMWAFKNNIPMNTTV